MVVTLETVRPIEVTDIPPVKRKKKALLSGVRSNSSALELGSLTVLTQWPSEHSRRRASTREVSVWPFDVKSLTRTYISTEVRHVNGKYNEHKASPHCSVNYKLQKILERGLGHNASNPRRS